MNQTWTVIIMFPVNNKEDGRYWQQTITDPDRVDGSIALGFTMGGCQALIIDDIDKTCSLKFNPAFDR